MDSGATAVRVNRLLEGLTEREKLMVLGAMLVLSGGADGEKGGGA